MAHHHMEGPRRSQWRRSGILALIRDATKHVRACAPAKGRNLPQRFGVILSARNQEAVMTDYRDPNDRDPNRPMYRDPDPMNMQPWSNATWGWIAGIAVVVLVLIFAFGSGGERTASNTSPPATTGQGAVPPPGPGGTKSDAPGMNQTTPRPAPDPGSR
jgi:hypothetical protein